MSNVNLQGLPPEMQARIAEIIEKAKGAQGAMPQPAAPVTAPVAKPPSLMEHVIALRGEVAQLQQQVVATGQVVDAIGQASRSDLSSACLSSRLNLSSPHPPRRITDELRAV